MNPTSRREAQEKRLLYRLATDGLASVFCQFTLAPIRNFCLVLRMKKLLIVLLALLGISIFLNQTGQKSRTNDQSSRDGAPEQLAESPPPVDSKRPKAPTPTPKDELKTTSNQPKHPMASGPVRLEVITVKGQTYTKATLTKSDELTVRIAHDAGVSRVPFNKLPSDLQEKLGYDPDAAAEAADKLAEVEAKAVAEAEHAQNKAQLRAALLQGSVTFTINVLSITGDGLLGRAESVSFGDKLQDDEIVFVVTPTEGVSYLTDHRYKVTAKESGTYTYTNLIGGSKTIRKYTNIAPMLDSLK